MRSITTIAAATFLCGMFTSYAVSQESFDATETQEIETIVRDYLIANPEVLVEAMNALQEKQDAEQKTAQADAIGKVREQLNSAPEGMVLGNPDGDVTVTEFFDYNCGYCRQALDDMTALLEEDGNVRFVLKEFPILGMGSLEAARVAMAFRDLAPEKYREFHETLLSKRSGADKASALDVAEGLGVDTAKIEEILAASTNMKALQDIQVLASDLRINGTPSYVIGEEVLQARVGLEGLKNAIASMRECGKVDCGAG
ncbi:outer membrane protein [Fulvimarina pelagi HTCC2506]|uniref:Outer membrane protein n=1 Tax=Fulvimarina pelagi HTCC2506 TaxID=314231 RepID=Q0G6Z4_9HYPH|nr:DsbA family protein [Fulvimarina pelagi]EAU42570.1 outer membrane protein [Fulvimarina pelagi HTCC2506]